MALSAAHPLFTAQPTRFAGRSTSRARLLLALLTLLLIGSLTSLSVTIDHNDHAAEIRQEAIVDDLRHGGEYYDATANALRADGEPLRPFLAFHLPTLAKAQSFATPVVVALTLYALALSTLVAWWRRLGEAFTRTIPRVAAQLLAAAGMAAALQGEMAAVHQIWAGLLIALSLAARRPGRWLAATALGLSAALVHESAALFIAAMALIALVEGERREATGWLGAIALFAVILAIHAQTVVPAILAALLAGLALFGWAAWRDPLATRTLATLIGYLLMLSFVARPDRADTALLVAPFALVGLAFAPDAIRDLARAALDRRRITVTRVMR